MEIGLNETPFSGRKAQLASAAVLSPNATKTPVCASTRISEANMARNATAVVTAPMPTKRVA